MPKKKRKPLFCQKRPQVRLKKLFLKRKNRRDKWL
jgi:hypothetical protein